VIEINSQDADAYFNHKVAKRDIGDDTVVHLKTLKSSISRAYCNCIIVKL